MSVRAATVSSFVLAAAACGGAPLSEAGPAAPEAISLLGEPLFPIELAEEARERLQRDLAAAQAAYDSDPDDADSIIWLGRRKAYLWRYREAIELFSEGIRQHPNDPRLYRHRGHRYITLRELDRAVADLTRAAKLIRGTADEPEPDGAPNPYGIPRSTLHSNIWYHLGLAHYLRGDFEQALAAYQECIKVSPNDDMHVATADWLYMTLRRLRKADEAARVLESIHPDMEILENDAYHRRLLMYKGLVPPESLLEASAEDPLQVVTQGYGVANWFLYNGDEERARGIFREILSHGYWPAFGHVAAEAELARDGR